MFRYLVILLLLISCNSKPKPDSLDLLLRKTTLQDSTRTHSTAKVEEDKFEVSLVGIMYRDGTRKFLGTKEGKASEFMTIVDERDSIVYFSTPEDFLKYISARSYEMIEERKGIYQIDYTFRKVSE